jgi:hypothetical protein
MLLLRSLLSHMRFTSPTSPTSQDGRAIVTMPDTISEIALSACLNYVYTSALPDSTTVVTDDDACITIMLADEWGLDAMVQSLAKRIAIRDVARAVTLLTKWSTVVNLAAMANVKKRALQLTRSNMTDVELEDALNEVARKRARVDAGDGPTQIESAKAREKKNKVIRFRANNVV